MIEWDSQAYRTKLPVGCLAKFVDSTDEYRKPIYALVEDHSQTKYSHLVYARLPNGEQSLLKLRIEIGNPDGYALSEGHPAELLYFQPKGRFYNYEDSNVLVRRKYIRDFCVGMWFKNYTLERFPQPMAETSYLGIDFHSPLKVNKEKTIASGIGPICDRFYLYKNRLFFFDTEIGISKRNKIHVINPLFIPPLKKEIGDLCKIESL